MKPWALGTVLAVREREQGAARAALARALALERRAEEERSAIAARVAAHAVRVAEAGSHVVDVMACAEALRARGSFAGRLREEEAALVAALAGAERALAEASGAAAACRAALAEVRGAVRALERHREGWRAERARGIERREEEAAEDFVSARRATP